MVNNDNPLPTEWAQKEYVSFEIQNNGGYGLDLSSGSTNGEFQILVFTKDGQVLKAGNNEDYEVISIAPGLKKTLNTPIASVIYDPYSERLNDGILFKLEGSVVTMVRAQQLVGAWRIP